MKYSLVLFIGFCLTFTTVDGSAVSCSVIDYLYYSSDCCDSSNTVQCMESIPQTDKAAIDNLASLKRPDGVACQSGDSIKFFDSKIVCADADTCIIPCANGGTISGTVSNNDCTCTCSAGFQGADCSNVTPCPVCQNSGEVTGSVAGGDCGCDCSETDYIGTECQTPKPITIELHEDGTTFSTADILTSQECFDNQAAILTAVLALKGDTTVTSWEEPNFNTVNDATKFANTRHRDFANVPKGCYVEYADKTPDDEYKLYFNTHATGADPTSTSIGINKG